MNSPGSLPPPIHVMSSAEETVLPPSDGGGVVVEVEYGIKYPAVAPLAFGGGGGKGQQQQFPARRRPSSKYNSRLHVSTKVTKFNFSFAKFRFFPPRPHHRFPPHPPPPPPPPPHGRPHPPHGGGYYGGARPPRHPPPPPSSNRRTPPPPPPPPSKFKKPTPAILEEEEGSDLPPVITILDEEEEEKEEEETQEEVHPRLEMVDQPVSNSSKVQMELLTSDDQQTTIVKIDHEQEGGDVGGAVGSSHHGSKGQVIPQPRPSISASSAQVRFSFPRHFGELCSFLIILSIYTYFDSILGLLFKQVNICIIQYILHFVPATRRQPTER